MKNRLRILRAERNWSQAELAKRLEVSRQTINALEMGKYDPSLPLALKIARLFGCAIETVFFPNPIELSGKKSMFERFTEKAVKSIMLAQEEARLMGHNFVGTEQILLGLIAEGTGMAAKVLKVAGVELAETRREVEKIIGRGQDEFSVEIPFTPRGKQVLVFAHGASSGLSHQYIGTEHLLLGLLRVIDGVAARVLENLGISLRELTAQVFREIAPKRTDPLPVARPIQVVKSEDDLDEVPADFTSGVLTTRFCVQLSAWVEPRQLGYVVSSGVGYRLLDEGVGYRLLKDEELVTPHCSFILKERLRRMPRTYPEVLPDLILEIKSAFNRLALLQEKVLSFIHMGVRVGLLIDPDQRTITVYRPSAAETVLTEGETLTIPELLPGWELPVSELWHPIFD
jgi:DNA-binding XRE family transcriptional regulator/Uma2 family endonuclease